MPLIDILSVKSTWCAEAVMNFGAGMAGTPNRALPVAVIVWVWESLGPCGSHEQTRLQTLTSQIFACFAHASPNCPMCLFSAKAPTLRTSAFDKCRASAIGRHLSKFGYVRLSHLLHSLLCCADRTVDDKPVVTEIPSSTERRGRPPRQLTNLQASTISGFCEI